MANKHFVHNKNLSALAMRHSDFYKMSFVAACAAVIGAIGSLLISSCNELCGLLALLFPLLWLMWLGCAIFVYDGKHDWRYLLRLWVLVDLAILFYLLATWRYDHNVLRSQGVEIGLGLMYFPVVIPTGFVSSWLLYGVIGPLFNIDFNTSILHGIGEVFETWIEFSTVAAIQSYLVIVITHHIKAWRVRRLNVA